MPVTYTPFTPPESTPSSTPPTAFTPGASTPSTTPPAAFTPPASTPSVTAPSAFTPAGSTPSSTPPTAFTPPASTPSVTAPVAFTPPGSTPSTTPPVTFYPQGTQLRSLADLAALPTEGVTPAASVAVEVVIAAVAYLYVLTAGAHAADSTHVRPLDYNASTNAKTWLLTATQT